MNIDPTTNDESMRRWIKVSRLEDHRRTAQSLEQILAIGVPFDLLSVLWNQLPASLDGFGDSDTGLDLFVRYLKRSRSPQAVATLFERDTSALPILMRAMSIGPSIAETLINDPEAFELLRITNGQPLLRQALIDEVRTEVGFARDDGQVRKILSRYRHREVLRIAFGQFIHDVSAEETYQQLSFLAEAILQSAFERAYREVSDKCGRPLHPNGLQARCCVIAFERLGATQQGYENSIRLLLLAETRGRTDATRIIANTDFFNRLSNCFLEYLAAQLPHEEIYHIQIIHPLQSKFDSQVVEVSAAFQHYDLRGRTWERQAFVQSRPIAGDVSLGEAFLEQLQPWVYRRYLGDPDIAGLGANQRKLQRKLATKTNHRSGAADDRSAADDIEQMVLFLQLLHGHGVPEIRIGNTLGALERLTEKHFLRPSELSHLHKSYCDFRRAEAFRIFQAASTEIHSTSETRRHIAEAMEISKRVIGSRLEESFPETQQTPAETDLILDPKPSEHWVANVLTQHRFTKPGLAYQHLMQLSEENISILSTRRCRYYLSIIAPTLLKAIALTSDPDQTLASLARMCESLGGKGVLWELMASNPATMLLIVRMSACSSYLVSLLIESPGMIDELMDSLLVDRLPRRDELEITLTELCRSSEDIDRVIHEFKNSMHLRVGVRDILRKESIVDTHRALSDIAEVCICRIIRDEYAALAGQFGLPRNAMSDETSTGYAVLAIGKLGGQEPNYHSDLSLVLLFEQDGVTHPRTASRTGGSTSIRHFFEQLAQRVMRRTNRIANYPRLYELDVRFGPLGKSGVLAMQLDQFIAYFQHGSGSAIERQSLCKARPIAGTSAFPKLAMQSINTMLQQSPFSVADRTAILNLRHESQSAATVHNLKRGEGGTVDIECLVQMLQLANANAHPEILVPGTLEAIGFLERAGIVDVGDAKKIYEGYYFLREIESGLRLMNTAARHDLPEDPMELNRLAFLLGWKSGLELRERTNEIRDTHREIFGRYMAP